MKRKKRRRNLLILEVIILIILVGGVYVYSRVGLMGHTSIVTKTNRISEHAKEMMSGYTNVALFGVDNRSVGNYDTGNSDSILVASINNETKEVKLVSIYRDTYMDVDGKGKLRKCNYAYNHGGVEAAVNMLNRNLDLDIEDYVTVDFYALADAVDALGGIELTVSDGDMAYQINDLLIEIRNVTGKKTDNVVVGTQKMNGCQALAYARIRHLEGGDFARAQRQREVISKVVEKAKKMNAGQLDKLITSVFPDIDTSLSMGDMLSLATGMKNYSLVDNSAFPTAMIGATLGKTVGYVNVPCTLATNVSDLHEYLFGDTEYTPSDTVMEISNKIKRATGYDENDAVDYGY